jgi:starch synthase
MNLLSVTSEAFPLVKTGGLADVAGALPAAFAAEGIVSKTLLPGYPAVMSALVGDVVHRYDALFGGPARLILGKAAGLDVIALDAPHLFDRPGNPYGPGDGFADNAFRFAAFARAAASIGQGLIGGFVPDILHAHDWQAGLAPAYLYYDGRGRPGTVMTIHNLAFQGQFDPSLLPLLGLPEHAYSIHGVEYYGSIGYLKSGLRFADRITTVSPTYATEICSQEAGMGMEGLLRARGTALSGILNGIDTDVWNPAQDGALAARFDADNLPARSLNKLALQARLGLAQDPGAPLFGVISRFSWQKGIDLVLAAIPAMLAAGGQLALLGSGDGPLEHAARAAIDTLAGRVGGVPVVSRVGGLVDTVIDASPMALAAGAATGVQFTPSLEMLEAAIARTVALYRDTPTWWMMQRNGMRSDVSWTGPARRYAALFRAVLAELG